MKLLPLVCLLAAACEPAFDKRAMVASIVDQVLVPEHADLAARTQELAAAATAFCVAPNSAGMNDIRAAWHAARASQKKIDVFAFGPYSDPVLRLGPKLDAWPARPDTIMMLLAGTQPIDAASLANLGTPSRGMPVIEWLLYAPGDATTSLAAFTNSARRCAYLSAAATDAATNAAALRDAWDPAKNGYAKELENAGSGSPYYVTVREAVNELYNRSQFLVENARELKLGKPAGKATSGMPQPDQVESLTSGRSLQDLLDNLNGLLHVLYGHRGTTPGIGMIDYLEARDATLVPVLIASIGDAIKALNAVPPPLSEAVVDHPAQVEAAYQALRSLHRLIGVDIANTLGVTVTFNDTDGD
jgi:uncharacterized protein